MKSEIGVARKVALWYARLSAPLAWGLAMAMLFAGLAAISPLDHDSVSRNAQLLSAAWAQRPLVVVVAVLLIPVVQALVFQLGILDGLARMGGPRWFWLAVSTLAFSVGLHHAMGWFAMLASAWVGLVFGGAYLVERGRSFLRASLMAVALQVGFATIAALLSVAATPTTI